MRRDARARALAYDAARRGPRIDTRDPRRFVHIPLIKKEAAEAKAALEERERLLEEKRRKKAERMEAERLKRGEEYHMYSGYLVIRDGVMVENATFVKFYSQELIRWNPICIILIEFEKWAKVRIFIMFPYYFFFLLLEYIQHKGTMKPPHHPIPSSPFLP